MAGDVTVRLKACAPSIAEFCCVLGNPNQLGDSAVLDLTLSWTSYLSCHRAGEGHLPLPLLTPPLLLVPFPLPDEVT